MAKESAVAKVREKRAKEAKEYKSSHDVERVHHLIAAASLIRDWPAAASLAASLSRELVALNMKQADLDAKEKEEHDKELNEAWAADTKATTEENKSEETESSPPRASRTR